MSTTSHRSSTSYTPLPNGVRTTTAPGRTQIGGVGALAGTVGTGDKGQPRGRGGVEACFARCSATRRRASRTHSWTRLIHRVPGCILREYNMGHSQLEPQVHPKLRRAARQGETISTVFVESMIDKAVSRRCVKERPAKFALDAFEAAVDLGFESLDAGVRRTDLDGKHVELDTATKPGTIERHPPYATLRTCMTDVCATQERSSASWAARCRCVIQPGEACRAAAARSCAPTCQSRVSR
jgi:hypothetical protein